MNTLRCEPLREHLGLDAILGTELEIVDGRCTGRIVGAFCSGAEKVRRAHRWAAEHDVDLAASYYYGDSHADVPMLEAVGRPVATNPNRTLEAAARARGWPIVRFDRAAP